MNVTFIGSDEQFNLSALRFNQSTDQFIASKIEYLQLIQIQFKLFGYLMCFPRYDPWLMYHKLRQSFCCVRNTFDIFLQCWINTNCTNNFITHFELSTKKHIWCSCEFEFSPSQAKGQMYKVLNGEVFFIYDWWNIFWIIFLWRFYVVIFSFSFSSLLLGSRFCFGAFLWMLFRWWTCFLGWSISYRDSTEYAYTFDKAE